MKKDFIKFFRGTIYYAYIPEGTNFVKIGCNCDFLIRRKCRELKITISSPEQFKEVKKYFGLRKNIPFTLNPTKDIDLLPEKNHEAFLAFSHYAKDNDLIAIADESGENFYHLPDGLVYAKEALFDVYKLKKIQTISNEITKLSTRIAELSELTLYNIDEA